MGGWSRLARWVRPVLLVGVALLVIQLVPYGRDHTNPPVTGTPPWASEQAAVLFDRACADCHSNTTRWPWYSNVAPVSWLLTMDVREGREELNVSRWDRDPGEVDEAAETILEGEMPPRTYVWLHPDADLSEEEARILVDALQGLER